MGPRCALAPTPPHPTLSPPCAVSPIGIRTQLPVVLSHRITQLTPDFFWLGAGEVDLKVWAGAGGGGGGVSTGAHRHEQAQPQRPLLPELPAPVEVGRIPNSLPPLLQVGMSAAEFVKAYQPIVIDCTYNEEDNGGSTEG